MAIPEPSLGSLESLVGLKERILSGEAQLINVETGRGLKFPPPDFMKSFMLKTIDERIVSLGGIGGLGGFGLSGTRVGMTGEIERARLDILERMRRTTDSRAKSRLTLPRLFGDGKTETNILADVL